MQQRTKNIKYPEPKLFNPSEEEKTNAAKSIAKYLSSKYVLKDPETNKTLARGTRETK